MLTGCRFWPISGIETNAGTIKGGKERDAGHVPAQRRTRDARCGHQGEGTETTNASEGTTAGFRRGLEREIE